MDDFWALIHKDEDTDYGVSFPDVPGCISAGATLEEALRNAREALSAHLALMKAEGDPLPVARRYDDLRADPDVQELADGAAWHLVHPRVVQAPRIRVNVMIDPGLLRETDEAAEATGMTRSGFIERSLRAELASESDASDRGQEVVERRVFVRDAETGQFASQSVRHRRGPGQAGRDRSERKKA